MTGPLDPDPLYVSELDDPRWRRGYDVGENIGYETGYQAGSRLRPVTRLTLLLGGCVLGCAVALAWVNVVRAAAPRSDPRPAIPAARSLSVNGALGTTTIAASGNLAADRTGAPPVPAPGAPAQVSGIASWVSPRYGPTYLALPAGPGHTVTICGRAACVTRTSTDAGPARFLQRQGRVADLSHADFARVCGCSPEIVGLTRVTVTVAGPLPTPPATDR